MEYIREIILRKRKFKKHYRFKLKPNELSLSHKPTNSDFQSQYLYNP